MKQIFYTFLIITSFGCAVNSKYQLEGEIKNFSGEEEYIYLVKFYSEPPEIDTAKIVNGNFKFLGNIDFPELYAIHYHPDRIKGIYEFYLAPGDQYLSIDEDNWQLGSSIEGSDLTDDYDKLFRNYTYKIHQLDQKQRDMDSIRDSVLINNINSEIDSVMKSAKQSILYYINNNPSSPLSPYMLANYYNSIPTDSIGLMLGSFSEDLQQTSIIKRLWRRYNMQNEYSNKSLEGILKD